MSLSKPIHHCRFEKQALKIESTMAEGVGNVKPKPFYMKQHTLKPCKSAL